MDSIEKQFQAGIDKAMAIRDKAYMIWLTRLSYKLIGAAQRNKTYGDMTGNTVTSYACGIYKDRKIVNIIFDNGLSKPIKMKLTTDDSFEEGRTRYDGDTQDHTMSGDAIIETDGGYGTDLSLETLMSFIPSRDGYALVMCTGTEYSEYLEANQDFDVLTKTFDQADNIINGLI